VPPRARSLLLAATLVLVAPVAAASPARAQAPVPRAVPLTTGWEFHADAADRGVRERWAAHQPADGWRGIALPHVFDPIPRKAEFGGTVGWYRTRFLGPASGGAYDWALRFEQVRRTARVWLNGREIGRHDDPYVPFTIVARGLRKGASNELMVRVDNRKGQEPREGWWNWGGIPRPVSLVPLGPLQLTDPGLMTEVTCEPGGARCRADVLVRGTVTNHSAAPISAPRVRLHLDPPGDGAPTDGSSRLRALMPGERTSVSFRVPVRDPKLWAPERPALYASTLTTLAGNAPAQVDRRRIGLRGVRVRNGLLELNGRQLDVRGASIQEDLPGRGPALRPQDIREIVRELKAVGANITRAHYLLNPKLLDALDAAGIMVWSQAPIYHRDRLLETPEERARALATVRDTVQEARSHPSVITHSVANELSAVPDRSPGTRRFLDAAVKVVRATDPTLPVSVDLLSYPGYPGAKAYRQFDLLGINSYFGWYPGKPQHSTAQLSDLGPYLDRMRRLYPTQAMVVTEFGAESTFVGPKTEKETYAFQSDYVQKILDIVKARPFVGGAIYWTAREFAVKPDWDGGAKRDVPRDAIHNKALITYGGREKPAWKVAERDFTSTPLYRDVPVATGLGLPDGRGGGGGDGLILVAAAAVTSLIAIDLWAFVGLRRGRHGARLDPRESP
jgi:hypothetical protein